MDEERKERERLWNEEVKKQEGLPGLKQQHFKDRCWQSFMIVCYLVSLVWAIVLLLFVDLGGDI